MKRKDYLKPAVKIVKFQAACGILAGSERTTDANITQTEYVSEEWNN